MLEKLLARITQKGAVSIAELSGELDTSPEMVEIMLAELERLGYLEAVSGCNTGACAGCTASNSCQPVRIWQTGKRYKSGKAPIG